ncbi:c-type cytochrome [Bdellovibrio sp. HCB185ZH]|uniref:c-type cytochrome n=1 Tax=Bdellovibrio sp. HCB185ZH TaxID=3394235 RepID=UPI0039A46664
MSENKDHYNRGGLFAFMFSMAFVFAFFFYLVVVNKGVDLAENVIDPNAPAAATGPVFDITTVKEPWVETPEMITYGQKFFKTNCAMCHGDTGHGDGAAGAALNPKPRNLVEGKWTQGDGAINHFKVVTNGIPNSSMAAFGHFKAADRWAVVHFINSITNNKSKDDPAKVAEFGKTAK